MFSRLYYIIKDDDDETLEQALDSGMDSLIKKPVSKNTLAKLL